MISLQSPPALPCLNPLLTHNWGPATNTTVTTINRAPATHLPYNHLQLNRDLVGYFDSRRPEVVLEATDKPFDFSWPQPEVLRAAGAGGSLMQLKGVSFTYPGATAPVLYVSAFGGALSV